MTNTISVIDINLIDAVWILCMVDFQTLELYPLQEHNISYFIRDYYIQVDSRDEELKVEAIYTPMLENGVKPGE